MNVSSHILDLRSDTLTKPGPAMRKIMAEAVVGDSFYDEDPSVSMLEKTIADAFGHEEALFVPSGTMSNQIAAQLHCRHGEALLGAPDLHILRAESGALSALAGVQPVALPIVDEFLPDLDKLDEVFVSANSIVTPPTRMLVVENTHLFSGGRIHPFAQLNTLSEWCRSKKMAFHLDGARLWNAHVATQIPLRTYGQLFTTISVCFSKGLGAPAGSCLVGSSLHIQRAKLLRKRLGGTMRQCGILAAAALYAFNHQLADLKEDHLKARKLANWLSKKYPQADVPQPETNIVLMFLKLLGFGAKVKGHHNRLWCALETPTRNGCVGLR
ncbi:low specificity L-threonine aldolase [bacterium]|nr:low specificity L-threonine aldolase [bacterium]